MRFAKAYIEISNICNLSCSFCPGTKRVPRRMTLEEFKVITDKLSGYVEYLYFHLLGEPLCHPELETFLKLANDRGFKVTITTNGTLIDKKREMLLQTDFYKIVFSLHSFEANSITKPLEKYLENCFSFGKELNAKSIVVYRLWNEGGENSLNTAIENKLHVYFTEPWHESRNGIKIGERTFLQYGDKFDWPDVKTENENENVFCYGLRDQIGILADGTVVPCCLDNDGTLSLGNIFESSLDEILSSQRAQNIYNGFSSRFAVEELCRKCTYVRKF